MYVCMYVYIYIYIRDCIRYPSNDIFLYRENLQTENFILTARLVGSSARKITKIPQDLRWAKFPRDGRSVRRNMEHRWKEKE